MIIGSTKKIELIWNRNNLKMKLYTDYGHSNGIGTTPYYKMK